MRACTDSDRPTFPVPHAHRLGVYGLFRAHRVRRRGGEHRIAAADTAATTVTFDCGARTEFSYLVGKSQSCMDQGNDGAVILWDVNTAVAAGPCSHGNNGKPTSKTAAGGRGTPKVVARCVLLLLLRSVSL